MRALLAWFWRFLGSHRPAAAGAAMAAVIGLTALVGPWLTPYGPMESFGAAQPPSAAHWLGVDSQGYDLLTRFVYGARTTLRIAMLATLMSLTLGASAGAIAGFIGGWTDLLLMRVVDFAMSFPSFLLAMVTVAILGRELDHVIIAVGLVGAPIFARQVRAEVVRVKSMDYITAAQAVGVSRMRILLRHVAPNAAGPVIVLTTLGMGSAILDVAGLNFLGLGGDPYITPEWGMLLNQGWREVDRGTLQVAVAGLGIFITVLGFNLLGDGLRDALDPRAANAK